VAGSITNPSSLPVAGDAFRVAVVWDRSGQALADGGYAADRRTTQDIAVTPVFPAQFQLDLSELPPDLQPFGELFGTTGDVDLRGVAGHVVAYEDKNHDGTLDLVTGSAGAFVDRVLGEANLPLLYLEGTMPSDASLVANAKDAVGNLPSQGFNAVESYCVSHKTPPAGQSCDSAFEWVPLSTPVTIALSADPKLADVMCKELPSSTSAERSNDHPPGEVPPTFPPAGDPGVKCASDGRSYVDTTDKTDAPPGICQASVATHDVETYTLATGAAAPSGWPCTVP
jgi:hypothetical protein